MDYEKKFMDFLDKMQGLLDNAKKQGHIIVRVEDLENALSELAESEDEKVRKELISFVNNDGWKFTKLTKEEKESWIAWLKKQGESDKSLYIRFGDIPTNGKSKIYNGEIEIGIEEGISVYPAFEDKEGNIILGLNLPITKTSLHTQQHLLEYDNRPCYIVTGDYIGKGTDGEPLIKNVRIIKEIKPYRVKEDKENNTYVINNTSESEDERIRRELIEHIKANCESDFILFQKFSPDEVIDWLEKQGEQKPKRVGTKKATGTLKEMLDNIDPIELEEARKEMLEVDGFDAELNALLKKYEYLPNDEMVECLKFYTAELINNKQRMEQ